MKKAIKLFGIIALVAIIGFTMTACGGDDSGSNSGGGGGGGPAGSGDLFRGTWRARTSLGSETLIANNGSVTSLIDGDEYFKGTYTVNGNSVPMIFTHINAEHFEPGTGWVKITDAPELINFFGLAKFSPTGTLSADGRTLTLVGDVFTKQ